MRRRAASALVSVLSVYLLASGGSPASLTAVGNVRAATAVRTADTTSDCNAIHGTRYGCITDVTRTPWGASLHYGCFFLNPSAADLYQYDDDAYGVGNSTCAVQSTVSAETGDCLPQLDPGPQQLADAVTIELHWNAVETIPPAASCSWGGTSDRSTGTDVPAPNWGRGDDEVGVAVQNGKLIVPQLTFQSEAVVPYLFDWAWPRSASGSTLTVAAPNGPTVNVTSASAVNGTATIQFSPVGSRLPLTGGSVNVCKLPSYEGGSSGCKRYSITAASGSSLSYLLGSNPAPVTNTGTVQFQITPANSPVTLGYVDAVGGVDGSGAPQAQTRPVTGFTNNGNGTYTVTVASGSTPFNAQHVSLFTWGCKKGDLPAWELNRLRANADDVDAVCDGQGLMLPNYWSSMFLGDWHGYVSTVADHFQKYYAAQAGQAPPGCTVGSGYCFPSLWPGTNECQSTPCFRPSDIYYISPAVGLGDEGMPYLGYSNLAGQLLAWAQAAGKPCNAANLTPTWTYPSGTPTQSATQAQLAADWGWWQECMLNFYQGVFQAPVKYAITELRGFKLHSDQVGVWAVQNGFALGQNGLDHSWGCSSGCSTFNPLTNTGATNKDVNAISKSQPMKGIQDPQNFYSWTGAHEPPTFELQSFQSQTMTCRAGGWPCGPYPASPPAAPSLSAGASTGVTPGAHVWSTTYVTTVGESGPGPSASWTVPTAGGSVLLGLGTPPTGVKYVKVYRSAAYTTKPGALKWVATIPVTPGVPITYQDRTADPSLGSTNPPPSLINCPRGNTAVDVYLAQHFFPYYSPLATTKNDPSADAAKKGPNGVGVSTLEAYHSDLDWATTHSGAYGNYHAWQTESYLKYDTTPNFFWVQDHC